MKNRKEYAKNWRKNNPNYQKKWLENNPEYMKEYYKKNKDRLSKGRKEYSEKWYIKNRERLLKKSKEWYINNLVRIREYRKKNRKKINNDSRMWRKTEKGKANNQRGESKRRMEEKRILNTLTAEEWLFILKKYDYRCAYCGKDLLNLFDKPTRDHIIPISKGGNNIKENVILACQSCNSKKGNKIL
jgi:5-methylcytosine-specific restriction endonuclease McrA